ncbi:primary-amine oxidase [Actinoplanes sp. NEAU-A12]|uniref:Amine oxidase n=1 Tax=Actinoplanes sandaracinus TaxID=3045177 RepID=A0ABT6WHU6_9ACTN|nr:primary-amine oxidase [Actinoplanes sandaracinus]MDI6099289.1 primary-amine oxidase [Actinoplanes sandaracinus]
MTIKKMTGMAAAAAAVVLGATTAGPVQPVRAAAPPAGCSPESTVKETLPNGTTWQMCWRMDRESGLVLEQLAVSSTRYPEPVQVLDSITLAQLNVPYDNGATEYNDITQFGFGGGYLQTLGGEDCKDGSVRAGSDGSPDAAHREVLCVKAEASGLAYRLADGSNGQPLAKQGHDLVLSSVSKVGWYEYVSEYRLHDDGQISARLGATGDLSPFNNTDPDKGWPIGSGNTGYNSNHYHSAFWRVDTNIGGQGGEKVEQYDTKLNGQGSGSALLKTTRKAISKEASLTTANRRWWRVMSESSKNKDGHNRSLELDLGVNDVYEAHPETTPDVTFTENKACERFATDNLDPQCTGGKTILDYARNKETLTDPVMWVRVGFHHVPRDEDQSPMPVHWQGFDLIPRDFTENNRLTPPERDGVNG